MVSKFKMLFTQAEEAAERPIGWMVTERRCFAADAQSVVGASPRRETTVARRERGPRYQVKRARRSPLRIRRLQQQPQSVSQRAGLGRSVASEYGIQRQVDPSAFGSSLRRQTRGG